MQYTFYIAHIDLLYNDMSAPEHQNTSYCLNSVSREAFGHKMYPNRLHVLCHVFSGPKCSTIFGSDSLKIQRSIILAGKMDFWNFLFHSASKHIWLEVPPPICMWKLRLTGTEEAEA